jgi:hypothetical protein
VEILDHQAVDMELAEVESQRFGLRGHDRWCVRVEIQKQLQRTIPVQVRGNETTRRTNLR